MSGCGEVHSEDFDIHRHGSVRGVQAGKTYVRPGEMPTPDQAEEHVDRPAPPGEWRLWAAYYAPGPGKPGDRYYVRHAGEGFRQSYKEARAIFHWRGGTKAALEAAELHSSIEARDLLAMLVRSGDLEEVEADRLRQKGRCRGGT